MNTCFSGSMECDYVVEAHLVMICWFIEGRPCYRGKSTVVASHALHGLVKILKKYDKRTGALIRLPFIQKVLQQPFFTTDLLYKLVKESERMLDLLFPTNAPSTPRAMDGEGRCDPTSTSTSSTCNDDELLKGPKELAEIEYMKSLYMKSTISALKALKEIRSKSSTVSMFSLPPLQLSGMEETWKKIPILEQVAK